MDPALKEEILSILQGASDMTIATVRDDGYPQATTVSYANDDLAIYFGCAAKSQKAKNIARSNKISLTVNMPYTNWDDIRGLSMGGRAERVTDPREMDRVGRQLIFRKFPQIEKYALIQLGGVTVFRVKPEIIFILDYRKGFGHTDIVRV
jgi:general stress protein 26